MSATEAAEVVLAAPRAEPAAEDAKPKDDGFASSTAATALLLFPAALTVVLSFNSGAFFPGTTALAAVMAAAAGACCLVLARRPFEGVTIAGLAVAGALALFAGWTLLSSHWSHAPARALLSYDRLLVYLLTLVTFMSMKRSDARARTLMYGIAGASLVVCTAALMSRMLPHVVKPDLTSDPTRLAYPLTYWNTLGLLAGVGLIFCGHLACSLREPRVARVLGAAAAPLLAITLFLTYSRGATWATLMGIAAYLLIARPRGALFAALATLPPTFVAALVVNPPSALTDFPDAPATIARGQHQALVMLGCVVAAGAIRAALLPLDRRLDAVHVSRRSARLAALGAALVVLLGITSAVASGAVSRTINEKVAQFKDGKISNGGIDRLLSASSNGRIDHWRVALDTYQAQPFHGAGAGTYELAWDRGRKGTVVVQNAHSLYLETLAELGWSGMLMLAITLAGILVALARLARGVRRPLYAALFAAGFAWVLAAAVDWDWQMPAVTLWLFAAGGLALAAGDGARARFPRLRSWMRIPALAACILLALAPLKVVGVEAKINRAVDEADVRDCRDATAVAASAQRDMSTLPKPAIVTAFCAVQQRHPADALAPLHVALSHDPNNWQLWYDLAVVRMKAHLPARRQIMTAYRLNAHDANVQKALQTLGPRKGPEARKTAAARAALAPLTP